MDVVGGYPTIDWSHSRRVLGALSRVALATWVPSRGPNEANAPMELAGAGEVLSDGS